MRPQLRPILLATSIILLITSAAILPPHKPRHNLLHPAQQQPMAVGPGIQLPPPSSAPATPPNSDQTLSDVMRSSRTISNFIHLTNTIDNVAARLDDDAQNSTVLAPTNAALNALPRKPWESPAEYAALGVDAAYAGDDGEARARENMKRFVEAHIVSVSPWKEGERVKTLGGREVWWEMVDGKAVIQPGKVAVEGVVSSAGNGQVWALDGLVDYAA